MSFPADPPVRSGRGEPERPPAPFRLDAWRIDPASREASDGTRERRLSPRAVRLLSALVAAEGGVVSRAALLDAVWPGIHVGDESLTQAVAEIRRALGPAADGRALVETVPKAGYRLARGVLASSTAPQPPATEGALPLEAHVAITEARLLARHRGVHAADEIDRLIRGALALAPDSAFVLAEYAVLMGLAAVHAGKRRRRLEAAGEAAAEAVRLRPDLLAAHRAFGFVSGLEGRMAPAMRSFSCALTLDPDDFETTYLAAQVCFGTGDLRKATVLGERAAELRADDYRPAYNAARAALQLGALGDAARLARVALRRIDAALLAVPDSLRLRSARTAAAAMIGEDAESPDATLARAGTHGGGLLYDVVSLAHRGERTAALGVLEDLVERGWSHTGWIEADPVSLLLRREPRFDRALERMEAA